MTMRALVAGIATLGLLAATACSSTAPVAKNTPVPSTSASTVTPTVMPTVTPTVTPTETATNTPLPTNTAMPVAPTATNTPLPQFTPASVATAAPLASPTPQTGEPGYHRDSTGRCHGPDGKFAKSVLCG